MLTGTFAQVNVQFSEIFELFLEIVTVHALRKQQRILPMLRILNRQNLLPPLYHTAFSVQKMPTRVQQP